MRSCSPATRPSTRALGTSCACSPPAAAASTTSCSKRWWRPAEGSSTRCGQESTPGIVVRRAAATRSVTRSCAKPSMKSYSRARAPGSTCATPKRSGGRSCRRPGPGASAAQCSSRTSGWRVTLERAFPTAIEAMQLGVTGFAYASPPRWANGPSSLGPRARRRGQGRDGPRRPARQDRALVAERRRTAALPRDDREGPRRGRPRERHRPLAAPA